MNTAGDLVALFRAEVSDQVAPYLWPDPEAYAFASDAQVRFCEKTNGIADATSTACELETVAGDAEYLELHPSIKKVRAATRGDTGRPIEIVNFEDTLARSMFFDGRSGPVRALVIGEQGNLARPWPVPSEAITIKLMVFRLPLNTLTKAADKLEVAAEHRQGLLHWMKFRAYAKQDAETYDQQAADRHGAAFEAFCVEAQRSQDRRRHKPRTVAYGGI